MGERLAPVQSEGRNRRAFQHHVRKRVSREIVLLKNSGATTAEIRQEALRRMFGGK